MLIARQFKQCELLFERLLGKWDLAVQHYRKEVSPYLSQNISRGSINNLTPFMIPAIFKADNDPIFSTRSVLSTVAI
jgi:hypothetical protein